jgi:hypothetical protein
VAGFPKTGHIYFQDEDMRQMFRAYPDFLCIDATYKLIELRFPVYIMLIEDGPSPAFNVTPPSCGEA